MNALDPAGFTALVALVGLVILVAGLSSGGIERLGIPAVALFLAVGTLLGPHGLGLVDFGIRSPALMTIATLSLVLVLFTDAVGVDLKGLKRHASIAAIVLGPGTLLAAVITGLVAWRFLGLEPAAAAIIGAALSSTDPVMMRGLLRLPEVPSAARYALRIESGLNDVVVLPIVLLAMVFLGGSHAGHATVGGVALSVFLVGPVIGLLIGWGAVRAMVWCRGWMGMRRDYESLYVLGIAFTAWAIAELLHASGFMSAFAAGLAVASLDVELCDCFHDYGEATAEMLLLLSFIAFGTSLIWSGLAVLNRGTLLVAAAALLGRPLVLALLLPRRSLEPTARRLIVWFGPRALSSFLLVLLPVFAGIAGADQLFPVVALVVLLSVLGHGALLAWATHGLRKRVDIPDTPVPGGDLPGADIVGHPELVTYEEMARLQAAGLPLVLLDARSQKGYEASPIKATGAIRISPFNPAENAAALALPREAWLIAYCA